MNARLHVLLASLCFGTTGTAQALGPDGLAPHGCGRRPHPDRRRAAGRRRADRPAVHRRSRGSRRSACPDRRRDRGDVPDGVLRRRRGHGRGRGDDRRARLGTRARRRDRVGDPRARAPEEEPGRWPPRWPAPAWRCSRLAGTDASDLAPRRRASRSARAPPTPATRWPRSGCSPTGHAPETVMAGAFGLGAVAAAARARGHRRGWPRARPAAPRWSLFLGIVPTARRLPAVRPRPAPCSAPPRPRR